jgi:hypothetical protein
MLLHCSYPLYREKLATEALHLQEPVDSNLPASGDVALAAANNKPSLVSSNDRRGHEIEGQRQGLYTRRGRGGLTMIMMIRP